MTMPIQRHRQETMLLWHTALNVTKVFSFKNIIIVPQEKEKVKGFMKISVTNLSLLFPNIFKVFYKKVLTNEFKYDIIILEIEIGWDIMPICIYAS